MPELPEVETTVRHLRQHMLDKAITAVGFSPTAARHFNLGPTEVADLLSAATVKNIDRLGKWMRFEFTKGDKNIYAVGHLRMSGRYLFTHNSPSDHVHNRFHFHLENGEIVNYLDQRRFGTFHFVPDFDHYPALQTLGPDALDPSWTAAALFARLQKLKKPIYSTLLDQTVVAGLGNIYVNETLHAAGIHPLTPSQLITLDQAELLVGEAQRILQLALSLKGTTLMDSLYQEPGGAEGGFYKLLQVYGKHKHPDIEVLKIGGRSVFVHHSTPQPYTV